MSANVKIGNDTLNNVDSVRLQSADTAGEYVSFIETPSGNQDITALSEYDVTHKATARISAAERAKIIPANIVSGVTMLGVAGEAVVPSGNQDIETLSEYNVASKSTARISATEREKIIPENIKKDITILGVTGTHEGGGQQPTLYPPVITGGVNTISWANNSQNGGFTVTLTADVDGTPATSPLTITQEMDGKTLTVTASATNFASASSTIVLSYINTSNSLIAISGTNAASGTEEHIVVQFGNNANQSLGLFYYNGGSSQTGCAQATTSRGNDGTITGDFCFVASASGNMTMRGRTDKDNGVTEARGTFKLTMPSATSSKTVRDSVTATCTVYDVTADSAVKTFTLSKSTAVTETNLGNYAVVNGHTYTFIINATFTAK